MVCGDHRAATDLQLAEMNRGSQQRGPYSRDEMLAMMNYRGPEPEVPPGWADWYEHGQELH